MPCCGIIRGEGGTAIAVEADAARASDVAEMVATTIEHFRRIDVLHNNVGIAETGGPVEASEESWNRVIAVNQTSVFLMCKHVVPVMAAAGGGSIVNTGSGWGLKGGGRATVVAGRD